MKTRNPGRALALMDPCSLTGRRLNSDLSLLPAVSIQYSIQQFEAWHRRPRRDFKPHRSDMAGMAVVVTTAAQIAFEQRRTCFVPAGKPVCHKSPILFDSHDKRAHISAHLFLCSVHLRDRTTRGKQQHARHEERTEPQPEPHVAYVTPIIRPASAALPLPPAIGRLQHIRGRFLESKFPPVSTKPCANR